MEKIQELIKQYLGNPNDNPDFHVMSYDLIKYIALLKDEAYGEDHFTFFMDRFLFDLGDDIFFSKLNRFKTFEIVNELLNIIYFNDSDDVNIYEIVPNHHIKNISHSARYGTYNFSVICSSSGFETKVLLESHRVKNFHDENNYTLVEEVISLQLFDEDNVCYFHIRTAPYKIKGQFQDINFSRNLCNLNRIKDINSFFSFLNLFNEEEE